MLIAYFNAGKSIHPHLLALPVVDPNSFPTLKKPLKFNFFHSKNQQKHISNQMKLYSHHAIPMGKLLQNTNLNIIFRSFNKTSNTSNENRI